MPCRGSINTSRCTTDATKKRSGKNRANMTGSPLTGKEIENVCTTYATPSQLVERGNGIDAGSERVLWGLPRVQREQMQRRNIFFVFFCYTLSTLEKHRPTISRATIILYHSFSLAKN